MKQEDYEDLMNLHKSHENMTDIKTIKRILLIVIITFIVFSVFGQNSWINEIHYDNTSSDQNEAIEIVINQTGNYDLNKFQVDLYNGKNGLIYNSKTLADYTIGDTVGTYIILYYLYPSIQNGPDAIALSYDSELIQFVAYEEIFSGNEGVALNVMSELIPIEETSTTPINTSLQYVNDSITWISDTSTYGKQNNNQVLFNWWDNPIWDSIAWELERQNDSICAIRGHAYDTAGGIYYKSMRAYQDLIDMDSMTYAVYTANDYIQYVCIRCLTDSIVPIYHELNSTDTIILWHIK